MCVCVRERDHMWAHTFRDTITHELNFQLNQISHDAKNVTCINLFILKTLIVPLSQ